MALTSNKEKIIIFTAFSIQSNTERTHVQGIRLKDKQR